MPHAIHQSPHRGGHLKLAASGHARQLIIFGHGGWKASDGTAKVRPTAKVYYYVADTVATVGHTLCIDICENSGLAYYGGLTKPAELSMEQATTLLQNDSGADPLAVMRRTKVLNQPVVETAQGGTSTSNYAIYHHPDGAGLLQKCTNGEIDDDLDVAINASDHKCHLSDIFDLCQRHSVAHHVIHYVACRVSR